MRTGTWIAVALMVTMLPACGESGVGSDGESAGDCPDGIILVDSPCPKISYCVSETEIVTCQNYSCEEIAGTPCCGGLSCRGDGPVEACPEGQGCYTQLGERRAHCMEPDDPEIATLGLEQYDTYAESCVDMTWWPEP